MISGCEQMGMGRVVDSDGVMGRRGFLWRGLGVGSVVVLRPYWVGCGAVVRDEEEERRIGRDAVVRRLRGSVRELLEEVEEKTGLSVEFRRLDRRFGVVAQYRFEQPGRPVVELRGDWADEDVAHELMHCRLELVEGYSVLAWRKGVARKKAVEMGFGLIRSYTDDMLVFDRLGRMGLKVDGEVIKRQLFEDVCTKVPRYLRAGRPLKDDGMAHLDKIAGGRYGGLRRCTFLVQVELVLERYGEKLSRGHRRAAEDFVSTFRKYRKEQAEKADEVLELFRNNNINDVKGHAKILSGWARLEGLDEWVGLSRYVRRAGGFVLPYPSDVEAVGDIVQSGPCTAVHGPC